VCCTRGAEEASRVHGQDEEIRTGNHTGDAAAATGRFLYRTREPDSAFDENDKCFLSRVSTAMLMCDSDIRILSVRLSVCHVPVLYRNGLTYRHNFFTITVAQSF